VVTVLVLAVAVLVFACDGVMVVVVIIRGSVAVVGVDAFDGSAPGGQSC